MQSRFRQRGAVLAVSLLMLVVVTLLAVASIQMGTVNLRIAENMRSSQEALSIAQEGTNVVLSDITKFTSPAAETIVVNDAQGKGHNVAISQPTCVHSQIATGYSAKWKLAPEDNTWQFTAQVTANDGATASINNGVKIRMTADSCP
ncbi:MAG: PilX N-terminal domain-containing pilus assembly protein [Halofilum sp. (in: g-proteobacteria)]|nr:PilX N-terminal domain-containing pilus assembly protein [Halofilum sp. (in: g-proteobacteria)]